MEGENHPTDIPDLDRIFLDEEASQELSPSDTPIRPVGFSKLKGFSGLHQVFEVVWNIDPLDKGRWESKANNRDYQQCLKP